MYKLWTIACISINSCMKLLILMQAYAAFYRCSWSELNRTTSVPVPRSINLRAYFGLFSNLCFFFFNWSNIGPFDHFEPLTVLKHSEKFRWEISSCWDWQKLIDIWTCDTDPNQTWPLSKSHVMKTTGFIFTNVCYFIHLSYVFLRIKL